MQEQIVTQYQVEWQATLAEQLVIQGEIVVEAFSQIEAQMLARVIVSHNQQCSLHKIACITCEAIA
ncbi:MAG: hypothetical protein ACFE0Q_20900 [Anaerolineae bacterium]